MPSRASNTAQGAAGGAALGTAILPGWGTAIGAVGGGILGFLGSDGQDPGLTPEQRAMYEGYIRANMGREAPTSELRKNQLSLISDLEAQSQGRGPSLAAAQLNSALDKNRKDQQAIANSARGSAIPLAAFQAQNNSMALGAQTAQDATAARIAEQVAARNQLGLTLHGARGMDEENALRQRAMNDALMTNGMSTFAGTPGQVSTGQQLMAGGVNSLGTLAQRYAANGNKPAAPAAPGYTPYGDNTMNPFEGSQTINPFEESPAAPGTSAKSMRPGGGPGEGTVTRGTGTSTYVPPNAIPPVGTPEYAQYVEKVSRLRNAAATNNRVQMQMRAAGRAAPTAPGSFTLGGAGMSNPAPLQANRRIV